ncbi:MAG TPA: YARHG domain-containing protein [Longimicrobiaceae bacterium]|nr:YARHG domain-containing protein [Longimicrobiaceae bacterium]
MKASRLGGILALISCGATLLVVPEVRCAFGLDSLGQCPASKPSSYSGSPWTSQRFIADADLQGVPTEIVRLMRNEIYARHGYVFSSEDLVQYFSGQPWYQPNPAFSEDQLSAVERANIARLQRHERR